jgi:nitrile hydratase subunit beta
VDSIADLGGAEGFGRVKTPTRDEPPFVERWEGRAFALTLLSMGRVSGQNLDAFRHALGRLGREDYFADGYYGRWLNAAELMLTESAILAPGAVDARARNLRGENVEEPAVPEPKKPDYAATAAGSLRAVPEPPRFAPGDRVRAIEAEPAQCLKMPSYVRGRVGVVESVQPGHLLPDTHARFQGENAQHVFTVRFDSRELWGPDAEPFALTIELFDSYLEQA